MNYILLIDEDLDILNIQVMVLSSFYGGDVIAVANNQEAIERIEALGAPELIVGDSCVIEGKASLYHYLDQKDLIIPIIVCSAKSFDQLGTTNFPHVSTFVQKPYSIESLSYLVKSITTTPMQQPDFIPVKLSVLLNYIGRSFDLYLRLSETNFVKLIKQGEDFSKTDSQKLMNKGVTHLYVSKLDSFDFLQAYEENLNLMISSKKSIPQDNIVQTIDVLSSIESFSKRMGWTPEVIAQAQKSIDTAIKILSQDAAILNVLKQRLSNPTSHYSRHIGLQAYLCCVFSSTMAWGGEAAQTKLALASLLHDLAVDELYYDDIKGWNEKASNSKDKSPETIKYRLHPIEASRVIQRLPNIPPDIDQILLQHHEKKDGSGFPRALTSNRIAPLSAFFIIIEELVDFIGDGENLVISFSNFKSWGDAHYDSGHFKKTYQFIRSKLDKLV